MFQMKFWREPEFLKSTAEIKEGISLQKGAVLYPKIIEVNEFIKFQFYFILNFCCSFIAEIVNEINFFLQHKIFLIAFHHEVLISYFSLIFSGTSDF